jgi:hypothetical protein
MKICVVLLGTQLLAAGAEGTVWGISIFTALMLSATGYGRT